MSKLKKLPADCTFPQLGIVLDAERFAACLQAHLSPETAARALEIRSVKVKRIYYKPGRSCRLTFTAKMRATGRQGEQLYFAKIVPNAKLDSTFRRAARANLTAPEFGPAVAAIRDLAMVLWAYPNDPNLPGLAMLTSRDAIGALLERDPAAFGLPPGGRVADLRLGVGKYVPGQRCGYRYRVRWEMPDGAVVERCFYGKAYQQGLGQGAHAVLAQLAASDAVQSGALRIPMPYGYDAAHEIVWQEMLPGISFAKETSLARLADVAAPVADALAAFHAAPLVLPEGLGLAHELEELAASTAKIARAYPQHAARCTALERRLVHAVADLEPVPAAPVHGSFKTSHMFDAGGRVAFIDFDGAGIGDPTYDVGRFLAHLAVTALDAPDGAALDLAYERFRDAYARRAPWGWADRRVRWYTAALLLSSQAYKCVKRMAPERVAAILTSAEAWFPEP